SQHPRLRRCAVLLIKPRRLILQSRAEADPFVSRVIRHQRRVVVRGHEDVCRASRCPANAHSSPPVLRAFKHSLEQVPVSGCEDGSVDFVDKVPRSFFGVVPCDAIFMLCKLERLLYRAYYIEVVAVSKWPVLQPCGVSMIARHGAHNNVLCMVQRLLNSP